jgi:hypothetical protein
MRTVSVVVNSEAEAVEMASRLVRESRWFQLEPLPDGAFEITVKVEAAREMGWGGL